MAADWRPQPASNGRDVCLHVLPDVGRDLARVVPHREARKRPSSRVAGRGGAAVGRRGGGDPVVAQPRARGHRPTVRAVRARGLDLSRHDAGRVQRTLALLHGGVVLRDLPAALVSSRRAVDPHPQDRLGHGLPRGGQHRGPRGVMGRAPASEEAAGAGLPKLNAMTVAKYPALGGVCYGELLRI